jgi:hypothetical protein
VSIREHRNPYLHKGQTPHKKSGPSRKRDREHNRAALSSELRNLIRISFVGV